MLDTINLKQKTLEWFGRKQFRSRSKGTLWPSEASVEIHKDGKKEVLGKCHRAVYYRLTGVEPTNPPDAGSQVIFLLGNSVEAAVIEAWKQMGLWENNSVKWEDRAKNLSGEYDVILREGDLLYGVEVKSFYGYHANKQLLGHNEGRGAKKRWIPGRPKDPHLMQASLYVAQSEGRLAGFKLFYVSRDQCDMVEFNITIDKDGVIYINGYPETRFTLDDIYDRYKKMNEYVDNDIKPAREFKLKHTDEEVEALFAAGKISKTAHGDHMSGKKKYVDWHCSYCDYKDHCWKVDKDEGSEPEVKTEEAPAAFVHGSL